jgi:hypothetical protein
MTWFCYIIRGTLKMSRGFLFILIMAGLASAKTPIATVTAAKSVTVNGIAVPTQGVPGLPVVSGDVITTGDEPAIVKLADGSTFMLDKNSSVKVQQCGATSVEVLQGTTTYRFAPASKAQLCALGHPATAAAMTQGSIGIESPDQAVMRTIDKATVSLPSGQCLCSTTSTKNHHTTILIVGLAGAAALGLALGLALTLPGSVSPSTPTT